MLYKQVNEQASLILQLQVCSLPTIVMCRMLLVILSWWRPRLLPTPPREMKPFWICYRRRLTNYVSFISITRIHFLATAYEECKNLLKNYKKQIETIDKLNEKNSIDISKHVETIFSLKSAVEELQKEKVTFHEENEQLVSKLREQEQANKEIYQNYMSLYNEFEKYKNKLDMKVKSYDDLEKWNQEYNHDIEQLKHILEEKYKRIFEILGEQRKFRVEVV